jgi:hypothetical protein
MMVPDTVKTHDELSLAQKKQVVTELNGFLKKSYNFSDESEYARAYEDLRHMFTTGSRKSISGLFENAVKKTGSHDSASALDKAIKTADGATGDKLYADVKAIYNLFSNILLTYSNEQSVQKLANEGTKKCLELAAKVKGVRDEAIRSCDEQIRLVKTISKKNGYAIHIVESGYGEQIVLTFPNESYADPHMWLGPNNSSNIQRAKALLEAFSK